MISSYFLTALLVCQIIPHFQPSLTDKVKAGVYTSLNQILEKRVVPSLDPLFDNSRMDLELRRLVRDTFPDFCAELKHDEFPAPVSSPAAVTKMDLLAETGLDFGASIGLGAPAGPPDAEANHANHMSGDDDAAFSDEDDDDEGKLQINLGVRPSVGPPLGGTRVKAEEGAVAPQTSSSALPSSPAGNNGTAVNNSGATAGSGALVSGTRPNHAMGVLDASGVTTAVIGAPPTSNCIVENEYKNVKTEYRATYDMLTTTTTPASDERTEFQTHLEYLEKDTRNYLEDILLEKDVQSR